MIAHWMGPPFALTHYLQWPLKPVMLPRTTGALRHLPGARKGILPGHNATMRRVAPMRRNVNFLDRGGICEEGLEGFGWANQTKLRKFPLAPIVTATTDSPMSSGRSTFGDFIEMAVSDDPTP